MLPSISKSQKFLQYKPSKVLLSETRIGTNQVRTRRPRSAVLGDFFTALVKKTEQNKTKTNGKKQINLIHTLRIKNQRKKYDI